MKHRSVLAAATILIIGGGAVAVAGSGGHAHKEDRRESRIERLFETFDLNADGQITQAEISSGREARFAAADTNSDGKLTEEEMRAAMTKRDEAHAERRVKRIMERADADSDGAVTLAEFVETPRHRSKKMFERLDANKDGVITRAEADEARGWRHGRKSD